MKFEKKNLMMPDISCSRCSDAGETWTSKTHNGFYCSSCSLDILELPEPAAGIIYELNHYDIYTGKLRSVETITIKKLSSNHGSWIVDIQNTQGEFKNVVWAEKYLYEKPFRSQPIIEKFSRLDLVN